jgi:hypothetical protein
MAEANTNPQDKSQVRLRINDTGMQTSYCNAFRTNASGEEVFIDMGVNILTPTPKGGQQDSPQGVVGEIEFQVNDRKIMNYATTKRLAIMLGQIVRRYEERHGEISLNENAAPPQQDQQAPEPVEA